MKRQAVLLKMKSFIICLWYNTAKNIDKLIGFIKCFPNTSFTKQVLGLLLIFHMESFLGRTGPWTSSIYYGFIVHFDRNNSSKNFWSFDWYIDFLPWHHRRHVTAKVEPRQCKSFSKKCSVLNYLSNEVYISSFCWHWFLTIWDQVHSNPL